MATSSDVLLDAFGRIREEVAGLLDDLGPESVVWRPDPEANSIAWLVWHLTRIQDDHVADAFDRPQLWTQDGWAERFSLPFPPRATGYGQTAEEMGQVVVGADLLVGYHEAVAARIASLVAGVRDADLDRVVDTRWDPPVTLAVRLVSVVSDALQHLGQAAYVKGLAERAGIG